MQVNDKRDFEEISTFQKVKVSKNKTEKKSQEKNVQKGEYHEEKSIKNAGLKSTEMFQVSGSATNRRVAMRIFLHANK